MSLSCDLKKHYLERYCSLSQTTSSAAATLRVDILSYSSAVKDKHWPPTVGTVTAQYGSPTDLVKLFLNSLLDIALATKKGEIETTLAELSIKQSKELNILTILPVAQSYQRISGQIT